MDTYIVEGKFIKIIKANSIEDAQDEVINDLTLGYGCDRAEITDCYIDE